VIVGGQHHSVGGGDADRRSAAHGHVLDGLGHPVVVTEPQDLDPVRKYPLVQHSDDAFLAPDRPDIADLAVDPDLHLLSSTGGLAI